MAHKGRLSAREEEIAKAIVAAALKVHRELGPGLLEKICEICFCDELTKAGFEVRRQQELPLAYDGIVFEEGLRLDVLVDGLVICELKAVDKLNPVWQAQILSHMKLTGKRLGFLINFNVPLIKDGIRRYIR